MKTKIDWLKGFVIVSIIVVCCVSYVNGKKKTNNLPDVSGRIIALSRIWDHAKELYPLWDGIDIDWDLEYQNMVKEMLEVEDEYEYILKLSEFNAKIQDGHSDGVIFFSNPDFVTDTLSYLPFGLDYVENKYIISRSFDTQKFPLGSELIWINGEETSEYLENTVGRIVGLQTPLAREFRLGFLFQVYGKRDASIVIKLKDASNREHVEIASWKKGYSQEENLLTYQNDNVIVHDSMYLKIYKTVEDFLIIRCFSFGSFDVYEEMLMALENIESKGIILDFRYCEGGNSDVGKKIVEYCSGKFLSEDNQVLSTISIGYDMSNAIVFKETENNVYMDALYSEIHSLYLNDYLNSVKRGEEMLKRNYLIDGKEYLDILNVLGEASDITRTYKVEETSQNRNTIILIGHKVGSAVDCVAAMANTANIVTVGTRTNGATGNLAFFDIGDNYMSALTLQNVLTPEGDKINNVGVQAQVYIEENLENFRHGIDTQLNYALGILGEMIADENTEK